LNITVQSHAGSLDFGLIACRRALPQSELHSLAKHLKEAFRELGGVQPKLEPANHPADPVPTVAAAGGKAKAKATRSGKRGSSRRLKAEARGARRHPADTSAQRNR
jgi:diacylglycerol O-acyltransferase / wax synthase